MTGQGRHDATLCDYRCALHPWPQAHRCRRLPEALKAAGLQTSLKAEYAERVLPPRYESRRDPITLLLNPDGLRTYARQLAEAVGRVLQEDKFPIVLGGDCSNIIGIMLALRRLDGTVCFLSTATRTSISRKQSRTAKSPQWI